MNRKEIIARRAARFFHPGDTVNLGIGIPVLCAKYADPQVIFQSGNGILGVGPTVEQSDTPSSFCNTLAEDVLPIPGASIFGTATALAIIRGGHLDTTVLGGMQVSEHGDLANWAAPGHRVGMGGAMDLCVGTDLVLVAMEHCTKDGTPKLVRQCMLPLTGKGCVSFVVTELGVFRPSSDGFVVEEIAAGYTLEEIQKKTAADVRLSPDSVR